VRPAKRIVLIVDDSRDIADSIAMALDRIPDIQCRISAHPSAALRLLNVPGFEISALITDLNLPFLNGLRLISEVRTRSRNPILPAILVTAEENVYEQNGDILSKPNFIIRKPFSVAEVCRVLQSLLE
jgi:DNA-binding response OmpR family regulator